MTVRVRDKPARLKPSQDAGLLAPLLRAIELLGTGLLSHPANRKLRKDVLEHGPGPFYEYLVRAAHQVMFILLAQRPGADGRARLHTPGASAAALEAYARDYGLSGSTVEDGWARFGDIAGAMSEDSRFEKLRARLAIAPAGGHLWAPPPGAYRLADAVFAQVVEQLTHAADVVAHGPPGVFAATNDHLGSAYQVLLMHTPRLIADGKGIALESAVRSERKATGSYYTPETLVQSLLDSTIEPQVREAVHGKSGRQAAEAILALRVCDPACGSGRFLVAAARRLAHHLAAARSGPRTPSDRTLNTALHEVMRRCIFGVDINPMAAELCKFSLWLATDQDTGLIAQLGRSIRCGNALLGVAPTVTFEPGADRSATRHAADAWCAHAATGRSGTRKRKPPSPHEVGRVAAELRPLHWQIEFPEVFDASRDPACRGFDVVLGNPPFLNQLETTTVMSRRIAALMANRYDGIARGYADISAAFLLLAAQITRRGGRVALVQPQSVLAVADAAPVRTAVLKLGLLESLWVSNAHVFDGASVFTCAPTIHIGGPRHGVLRRTHGLNFDHLPDLAIDAEDLAQAETWSHLLSSASGIPEVRVASPRSVSAIADATADFRDQYYGLDGFIIEDAELRSDRRKKLDLFPPIVTTGQIDLAVCRWGVVPTRILKARWLAPRIDRRRMNTAGQLGPWLTARLVPKVLLATQTRVLEAFVDADGTFVPSLPLITVTPKRSGHLWHVAAAVASPVCSMVSMQKYAGAALNSDAIKLSARQVLSLPLPTVDAAWDAGAESLRHAHRDQSEASRAAHLQTFGERMCAAYGLDAADRSLVMNWWARRARPSARSQKRARTDSNRRPAV